MEDKGCLGEKEERQKGKLNDEFYLVLAGVGIYDISLENHWCCFRKICSLSLQLMGEGKGQVLREETCKDPMSRVWSHCMEVGEKGKPSTEARVG